MDRDPHATHLRNRDAGSADSGQRLEVSVVFPCLNEERSVALCVRDAFEAMRAAGIDGEVIVVDDGSTDDSARVAHVSGARVIQEERSGYGSALRTGIAAARGEIVVMADADCTYELSRLGDLVRPVADREADLVLGSRLGNANLKSMPFLHRFLGTPVLSFLVSRASGGLDVRDSQSGFRAFRRERFLDLCLRGTGMEFASEMLIAAARAGWVVSEIDTNYTPRIGESKLDPLADGWRHVKVITLLAPDLVLVWPGAAALFIGLFLSLWAIVIPSGLHVGSLRWQPIFFSTIATVFGAQSLLAGCVLAHTSSVARREARHRVSFVGRPKFPGRCVRFGSVAAVTGLTLDAVLFLLWISNRSAPDWGLPLASLAQTLLIVGSTLAAFGVVWGLVGARQGERSQEAALQLEVEPAGDVSLGTTGVRS